jgi:Xaa-Pro dipeptidase
LAFRQVGEFSDLRSVYLRSYSLQESNFYYLTGCSIPSSFALLIASSTTSDPVITLFIPDAHPADLMWSVPPPTIPEVRETHDASNVLHTESFPSSFVSALNAAPDALVHTLPQTSQFPALPPSLFADASHSSSSSDAYLLSALHRARLTKSDAEVQRVRRANEISSRAHEVVMRVLGAGVRVASLPAAASRDGDMSPRHHSLLPGEWLIEREAEAEAIFVASCRREGYAVVSPLSVLKFDD